MNYLPFSSISMRSSLVLLLMLNAPHRELWRGLAAGRAAGRRLHKRKDDKRRNERAAEMQVLDSASVGCSVAGGTQRSHRYPPSDSHAARRASLTWLPVEKWEGVRGRVAA